MRSDPISPKSKATAAVLCLFLGGLGVHRWYVGKVGTGLIQAAMIIGGGASSARIGELGPIVVLVGLGWVVLDFVAILMERFTDDDDRYIVGATERIAAEQMRYRIDSAPVTEEEPEVRINIEQRILLCAKHKGGVLVPTDVAMTTGIAIDAAQRQMEQMVQKGYMQMHVRHDGILVYTVPDMLTEERRAELDTV